MIYAGRTSLSFEGSVKSSRVMVHETDEQSTLNLSVSRRPFINLSLGDLPHTRLPISHNNVGIAHVSALNYAATLSWTGEGWGGKGVCMKSAAKGILVS